MDGMTTFGNNDSVFSHGEDSISMLNRLAEIAKGAYKYIPEKDCTVEYGTLVSVDTCAFLSAVQHFRESIEAYRDLTEELNDALREVRKAYADDMERIRKYGTQSVDTEKLFEQLNEECEHFRLLAISRNKELEREREKSNQLEQQLIEFNAKLDKKCREVGELTSVVTNLQNELDHVYEKIELIKADRDRYFKQLCESGYFDTDIASMFPKINNPQNFCGNCEHFEICSGDVGICTRLKKHKRYKVVDPDDASCKFFKPTYDETRVVIGKPEFPVCEKCNHDDCDNCTLCPF